MRIIFFSAILSALIVISGGTTFGQEQGENTKLVKPEMDKQVAQNDTINSEKIMVKTPEKPASEFHVFIIEADRQFTSNEKQIAELKEKYLMLDKADETIKEEISKLEQKNSDLKKTIVDFEEDEKNTWKLFKIRFNYNMKELQIALKEFAPEKKD